MGGNEPDHFGLRAYLIAVLAVLAATAFSVAIAPVVGLKWPFLPFTLAVMVAARFGGKGPALAATAASLLAVWYALLEPRNSFALADPADAVGLAIFLLVGAGISVLAGQLREALVLATRSERALQREAELVELSHDAIIVADGHRVITGWNAGAVALYGWKESEAIGKVIHHLLETESRVGISQIDETLMREGRWEGELRHIRSDGTKVLVESCQVLVRDSAGAPSGILEINRDVTERRRVEVALAEVSEHRRMALDSAGLGAWDYRFKTGDVFWDDRCSAMFGIAPGTRVTYQDALARIHSDDRPAVDQGVEQALAEVRGGAYHEEFRVIWPDNSVHWIDSHGRAYFEGEGSDRQAVRFIGVNLDITERKRNENALRRSEALLRAVSENTPDCLFLKDRNNRFLSVNRATLRLFGKREDEVIGKGESDCMLDPAEGMEIEANDSFTMDQGDPHITEETILTPEGSRMFLTTKTPWRDAEGKVTGLIGVARDITERKLAQEEVLRLNAELEQRVRDRTVQLEVSNRELEAFSYSVSHDLRAPLRGIDGWSLALLEEYGERLDQPGRGYLERVRSETQRMGSLIDDLLKLSRVTRSQMQVEAVDMTALANAIAARLREGEPTRQIEFRIQPGLTASGDARLVEVALTNLLSNAVKFTGPRALAEIEFGQTQVDGELAFYVRDNGVGFNMAYAHTLFGAFQRLHKPSEFPGTGIGLATVQRVIHRHGGQVWVEAQLNQGATFYFTLGAGGKA